MQKVEARLLAPQVFIEYLLVGVFTLCQWVKSENRMDNFPMRCSQRQSNEVVPLEPTDAQIAQERSSPFHYSLPVDLARF